MTVIQRTPNLGLTLRMQRLAAPAVAPVVDETRAVTPGSMA